jgi:hypothetical protein
VTRLTPQGAAVAAAARLSRLAAARPERAMYDRGATDKLAYKDPWSTNSWPREALRDISSRPTDAGRSVTLVAVEPWPDHHCFTSVPANSRRGAPHLVCGPYSGRIPYSACRSGSGVERGVRRHSRFGRSAMPQRPHAHAPSSRWLCVWVASSSRSSLGAQATKPHRHRSTWPGALPYRR